MPSVPHRDPTVRAGELGKRIAARLEGITLEKVSEAGIANAHVNAPRIACGRSIRELQKAADNQTGDALVIAAGPSLHRQDVGRLIKESGFKGMILTTESALSWCLRQEIIPDLVVTLDPHPSRIVRWFGDPKLTPTVLEHDNYFGRQDMDPNFRLDQLKFNAELVSLINKYAPRMRIAIASSASAAVVDRIYEAGMLGYWWNPMYDDSDIENSLTRRIHKMNGLPCVNAGGNVGSACWVFAHAILGARRVGLLGMDFAYYGHTPYAQTQYYEEILDLVGPERLDEIFVRMLNPHVGQEFYTDPCYLWYRDAFLEMVQEAECDTFNCTGGGILFGPGIHWLNLRDFLSPDQ